MGNSLASLEKKITAMQKRLMVYFETEILPYLDIKDGIIQQTPRNKTIISDVEKVFQKVQKEFQVGMINDFKDDLLKTRGYSNEAINTVDFGIDTDKIQRAINRTSASMDEILGIKDGKIFPNSYLDVLIKSPEPKMQIKNIMVEGVFGGMGLTELRDNLKSAILGRKQLGRDPVMSKFERYYRQYAFDTLQKHDRTYNLNLANELNVNKYFIYIGGKIEASRPFCIFHTDKNNGVWTVDESKEWVNWKDSNGEKEPAIQYMYLHEGYNPLIDCGGYNCRHHISFISEQMAKQMRPDLF